MKCRVLLALAACAFVAADKPDDQATKKEWKKLEGTWTVMKMEVEGRSLLE
jgi:hypothetical protein